MRLFVDNVLRRAFVHVGMRFELEQQVKSVNKEKHNAGPTADFKHFPISIFQVGIVKSRVECRLNIDVSRGVLMTSREQLTGSSKLMTLKLSRQALI